MGKATLQDALYNIDLIPVTWAIGILKSNSQRFSDRFLIYLKITLSWLRSGLYHEFH